MAKKIILRKDAGKEEVMEESVKEKRREIDIEFRDVCLEFLRRWRIIVISAVVFAIVFGAVQYRKDYIKANTPTPVQEEVKEPTLEEVYSDLNKDEMERVIVAVQLAASIDARSLYMNESVLMSINPYSEDTVILQYFIEGDSSENIAESYKNFINSGSVLTMVRENFESDLSDEYLAELITVNEDTTNKTDNFSVKIVYDNADTVQSLADAVQASLEKYRDKLNQNGQAHSLVLVNEAKAVVVDTDLAEKQDRYANDTLDEQKNLASIKSDMNTNQLRALIDLEKDIFQWNSATDNQENEQSGESNTVEKLTVHINVTQVLIGVVIGLIFAMSYIFFSYLATGKIRNKEEINNFYNTRVLGEVTLQTEEKRKAFSVIDNVVKKLEYVGQKKLTVEEQIEMIVSNIYLSNQQDDNKKICVTGSVIENISEKLLDMLEEELTAKNIEVVRAETIAYHSEALITAAEIGKVVLIEEKRTSYYREIVKEMQLCKENNIGLLGIILLEK